MRSHAFVLSMSLVLVAFVGGCNRGPASPKLLPVHGTVTLDGKPLSGVVVTFTPIGSTQGGGASCFTDSSGQYELLDRSGKTGAPVGAYRVSVARPGMPGNSAPNPATLLNQSQLHSGTATVPEQGGAIDFALKSK
jgi:hypothetical protein